MKRNIEEISKSVFEKTNGECEVVSTEYINNRIPLVFRCKCGNTFKRILYDVEHNGKCLCPECRKLEIKEHWNGQFGNRKRYTLQEVEEKLAEKDIFLQCPSDYVNTHSELFCLCKNGHSFTTTFRRYVNRDTGCPICAYISRRGEKNTNYNGGMSKTRETLRKALNAWKKEILELYDNKCAVTNESEDLEVHHLKSFAKIIKDSERKTGVELKPLLKDYEDVNDFYRLKNEIIKENYNSSAIVVKKSIHKDFHKKYGIGNNKPKQFDEFLQSEYGISLREVKRDLKRKV